MKNVIIAFINATAGTNISNLLRQRNYNVLGTVSSGTEILRLTSLYPEGGIIISQGKLADTSSNALMERIPYGWEMVVVYARQSLINENIFTLMLPVNKRDFIGTIDMLFKTRETTKAASKRSNEEIELITRAKQILMARNNFSENEAHRFIQKRSMNSGTSMIQIAKIICEEKGD